MSAKIVFFGVVIGEGAYGKVYKCKCPNLSKNLLAMKKMPNRTAKETRMNLNEVWGI